MYKDFFACFFGLLKINCYAVLIMSACDMGITSPLAVLSVT